MTIGNMLGPQDKTPLEKMVKQWTFYFDKKCPKCNGRIIENKKYIECGELRCNYIMKVK